MSGGPMDRAVDLATLKAGAAQAAVHPLMPKGAALAMQALARLVEWQGRELIALRGQLEAMQEQQKGGT